MPIPRSTRDPLFRGRWFEDEVIIVAVRWYLTYPLSYRQCSRSPGVCNRTKLFTPITRENARQVATRALFHECRHAGSSERRLKAASTLAKVMRLL